VVHARLEQALFAVVAGGRVNSLGRGVGVRKAC